MKNYNKYLVLALSVFFYNSYAQNIDQSILSQFSPEQIEMAKKAYSENSYSDESPVPQSIQAESLVNNEVTTDANVVAGKKYGYDFFSSMPTSLTAVGDLPLPNDYIISLRDQFTIILTGSKEAMYNLNVKLEYY